MCQEELDDYCTLTLQIAYSAVHIRGYTFL